VKSVVHLVIWSPHCLAAGAWFIAIFIFFFEERALEHLSTYSSTYRGTSCVSFRRTPRSSDERTRCGCTTGRVKGCALF
jgi:hypothetical protein